MHNQRTNQSKILYGQATNLLDRFQSDFVLGQQKEPSQFGIYQVLFSLENLLLKTETKLFLKQKQE